MLCVFSDLFNLAADRGASLLFRFFVVELQLLGWMLCFNSTWSGSR